MLAYAATYLVTLLVFLGIDSIWLTVTAHRLYQPLLGPLLREDFDPVAAALFYLLYIAGIVVLAVAPSPRAWHATARGAFLGLVAYGTYDLTNQATLRQWPLTITLADLCWGTLLTAIAATAGDAVLTRLKRASAAHSR